MKKKFKLRMFLRRGGGMADAQVSGTCGGNTVWVQLPSPAPNKNKTNLESNSKFVLFFNKDWFGLTIGLK